MGKQIHLKKVESLFARSPTVDFSSIARVVGKKDYAKLLVSNLLKKGKIKKLAKGIYTQFDESTLAVFGFQPAYLGLQSALSYYNLWEQEAIPVILTTKKVRRGIRNVLESNVLVCNISAKYFFGFEYVKEGQFYLPYSDLEKTLIDMVVFNQSIDKEVLKVIKKRMDRLKLQRYLKRYPKNIIYRVEKLIR